MIYKIFCYYLLLAYLFSYYPKLLLLVNILFLTYGILKIFSNHKNDLALIKYLWINIVIIVNFNTFFYIFITTQYHFIYSFFITFIYLLFLRFFSFKSSYFGNTIEKICLINNIFINFLTNQIDFFLEKLINLC